MLDAVEPLCGTGLHRTAGTRALGHEGLLLATDLCTHLQVEAAVGAAGLSLEKHLQLECEDSCCHLRCKCHPHSSRCLDDCWQCHQRPIAHLGSDGGHLPTSLETRPELW